MSDENRRGFLKQLVAAGSTLILPNSDKKIILPTEIAPPPATETQPCIDLGDCIVIPKKNIKSWQAKMERPVAGYRSAASPLVKHFVQSGPAFVAVEIEAIFYQTDYEYLTEAVNAGSDKKSAAYLTINGMGGYLEMPT